MEEAKEEEEQLARGTAAATTTTTSCRGGGGGNDNGSGKSTSPAATGGGGCCGGGDRSRAGCCDEEGVDAAPNSNTNTTTTNSSSSALCLAVIREDGADVVVFDASGKPRPFRFDDDKGDRDVRKLCFSTHGFDDDDDDGCNADADRSTKAKAKATTVGDLLTPCFDEDGNHGVPDEGCFCGVGTPHLHAHLRDPETCDYGVDSSNKSNNNKKSKRNGSDGDIGFLASQILHPVDREEEEKTTTAPSLTSDGGDGDGEEDGAAAAGMMMQIDVSERLPKECNSSRVRGHHRDDDDDDDQIGRRRANADYRRGAKKLAEVRHGDHYDYLVHDAASKQLRLQHPCKDCGSDDVHGVYRNVGERKLTARGGGGGGAAGGDKKNTSNGKAIEVHFFEVANTGPFNILEHLHNVFEPTSTDRVAFVEHMMENTKEVPSTKSPQGKKAAAIPAPWPPSAVGTSGTTVRSTFDCQDICCAAEIGIITCLLDDEPGIHSVVVNASLKRIQVHHEPQKITADDIAALLCEDELRTTVLRDGGAAALLAEPAAVAAAVAEQQGAGAKGRSKFFVDHICCASEIPAINAILEPLDGVHAIKVNTTSKLVYVDHSIDVVTAQQICDALNGEGFGADVRHDAATALAAQSSFVRSRLEFELHPDDGDPDLQCLTEFLSTFDASQMESFVVDVPSKTITVVHNPFVVTAQTIVDALHEDTGIASTVLSDGADPRSWGIGADSQDDDLDLKNDERHTRPKLTVIISGICWIISMLSYIGGNW